MFHALRANRFAGLAVVNLRILLGFAFVPAGLKKLIGEPFTDPANSGVFHEFLHGFYATGPFYSFVGAMQLLAAVLLMTQSWASLGAALMLPIITAITAFCWSTAVYPTASVATLMWLGTVGLLLWDGPRWRWLFASATKDSGERAAPETPAINADLRLWRGCGLAILGVYGASCVAFGGVYRPRGAAPDSPAFYVMPAIALLPLVALFLERRRRTQALRPTKDR